MGRKHPAFVAGFDDHQTRSQGEELTACVAVRRRPIFRLAAVEGEGEHGHAALGKTAEFFQPDLGLDSCGNQVGPFSS